MNYIIKRTIYASLAIIPLTLNSCCYYYQSLITPNGINTIEINETICNQEEKSLYKNKENCIIKRDSSPSIINTIQITTKNHEYLFNFNKLRKETLAKYGIQFKSSKYKELFPCNLPKNNSIINNIILHNNEKRSTRFVLLFYPCGLSQSSIDVLYDKNGHVNLNINNNLVIKPDSIKPINK